MDQEIRDLLLEFYVDQYREVSKKNKNETPLAMYYAKGVFVMVKSQNPRSYCFYFSNSICGFG